MERFLCAPEDSVGERESDLEEDKPSNNGGCLCRENRQSVTHQINQEWPGWNHLHRVVQAAFIFKAIAPLQAEHPLDSESIDMEKHTLSSAQYSVCPCAIFSHM